MKKIISCLLILTLLLCMVGCFGEDKPSGSEKESVLPSQGETGSQETGDEATGEEIDGSSTEQNSTAGTEEEHMTLFPLEPDKTDLPSYAALCSIEPTMTKEKVFSIAGNPQRIEIHKTSESPLVIDTIYYIYDSSDGPSVYITWGFSELYTGIFGSKEEVVTMISGLHSTDLPSYAALCSIEPGMTKEEVFSIAGDPQKKMLQRDTLTPETSATFETTCFVYDSSDGPSIGIFWNLTITSSGEFVETVEKIVQE